MPVCQANRLGVISRYPPPRTPPLERITSSRDEVSVGTGSFVFYASPFDQTFMHHYYYYCCCCYYYHYHCLNINSLMRWIPEESMCYATMDQCAGRTLQKLSWCSDITDLIPTIAASSRMSETHMEQGPSRVCLLHRSKPRRIARDKVWVSLDTHVLRLSFPMSHINRV